MNVVTDRLWRFDLAPFSRQAQLPKTAFVNVQTTLNVDRRLIPWIKHAQDAARSGTPQVVVLVLSVLLLLRAMTWKRKHIPTPTSKASKIKWPYEVVSQIFRVFALGFLVTAYIHNEAHLFNAVAVGYAFTLGLLRPAGDVYWKHAALHQINLVLIAMALILATAQYLPCLQIGTVCERGANVFGAVISLGCAIATAALTPREWIPPQFDVDIPGYTPPTEPAAEEKAGWLNYFCTYEWLTPLLWKGARGVLNMSGVPAVAWYDDPQYLLHKILDARSKSKSTLRTAFRFQWQELMLMVAWSAIGFAIENVLPYAMFMLLDYIAYPDEAQYRSWVWLTLLFAGPMSRSILFQQYVFTSTRLIVRIKSAMTQELYHRALSSMELEDDPFQRGKDGKPLAADDPRAQKTTSAGRLANLMAADVDAIFRGRDIVMISVGMPIGTAVSLIGLYQMLGWASIVGTVVLFTGMPFSAWLSRLMYFTQLRVRKSQDARISLVTEYLASIRAIKFFAWEKAIASKITRSRSIEQKGLWNMAILQTAMNQFAQGIPFASLLVMFALHVTVAKQRLDASTAFTTVYLVKNIRRNTMMASGMARAVASALVAIGRLDKYFDSTVPLTKYPVGPLRTQNAFFRRNKKAVFRLENISLDFVEGGLNVITGQSGSGKTTLLLALMGETYLEGGTVTTPSDMAYASQTAWLQRDTIKANILFGSPLIHDRYQRVLRACCLNEDLREFPNGDATSVGESGTSLSGGQKARVALARALYSEAPVLLLDDVFSALDAKTSAGVWKRCFCQDLLKGRTVVLVTQIPWISSQADYSINLDRGIVESSEANIGVVRRPIAIAEVLGGDAEDDDAFLDGIDTPAETQPAPTPVEDAPTDPNAAVAQKSDIVDQEANASGKIGRLTFLEYMQYFGNPMFGISCLVGLFLSNVFFFGSSYWLSLWVEAYEHGSYVNVGYYLGIFATLSLLELTSFGAIVILFEWGAWRAARKLHNDFVHAVLGVSLSWFKLVPVGRITNRFSSDMASIDGQVSMMLRTALDCFMMVFFRIASVGSIMPVFMIPIVFVCAFGIVIGEMYTRTAVVVKRLASSSQSPVFSQFADTLAGLPVIRARAGKPQAFGRELADKLRIWSAAAEANYNCNRWVAVRVDFVTSLVSLSAGIIAVSKVGVIGAGLVGFSLSNANALNQTILQLVRSMNDLEVEIQSFHRVKEYAKLEPEDQYDKPYAEEGKFADDEGHVIPHSWPTTGEVELRNVTIRYDEDGPNILTNINLKFRAGERVAVVGRTGSGKSTLVLSMLRFTNIVSGQILYDGIDITRVPRSRLRESLTIIPQEAVLFNGTVESNLDPTGLIPHERLEKALVNCKGIASFSGSDVSDNDGVSNSEEHTPGQGHSQGISLATEVQAQGENFSHGQRQVLSLCRALTRESKLMLLDEATASMDYETDKGIQQVLRKELEAAGGDRTLVTIAHRLRTIIDYDSVIVMSAGNVVEYGSPRDLYNKKGLFYDMMFHSGEMEELQAMLDAMDSKTPASSASSSTQVDSR